MECAPLIAIFFAGSTAVVQLDMLIYIACHELMTEVHYKLIIVSMVGVQQFGWSLYTILREHCLSKRGGSARRIGSTKVSSTKRK